MKLNYTVVYSKRRTLSLIVERDGAVVVRAPLGTSDTSIRRVVEAKRLWLYEKTNHKQKYPAYATRKEFVAGETLLYLGRNYRLDLTNDDMPGLHFNGGFTLSRRYRTDAARLVREWYIERARQKLPAKVDAFAKALGVTYGRVLISDLKVRWGSCTPKNNLNFNWRIIKAPTFVIDYVIVHELAHLLEPNHTPRFWNIVSVQVPRYEEAKAWLRENGRVLEEEM
jgi:predicted metal-dependent hydrolase